MTVQWRDIGSSFHPCTRSAVRAPISYKSRVLDDSVNFLVARVVTDVPQGDRQVSRTLPFGKTCRTTFATRETIYKLQRITARKRECFSKFPRHPYFASGIIRGTR